MPRLTALMIAVLLAAAGAVGAHAQSPSPLTGVWRGAYSCGQVATNLELTVTAEGEGLAATFAFDAGANTAAPARGSFTMGGAAQPDGSFSLTPRRWVNRPATYEMVGLSGRLSGNALVGRIDHPACGEFRLQRTTIAAAGGGLRTAPLGQTQPAAVQPAPSPPTPATSGDVLGARNALAAHAQVNGESLFAASRLSETTLRRFAESYLGGRIVFMPIRQMNAVTLERERVSQYLVPFCVEGKSWCKEPFSTIDGAWLVKAVGPRITHYAYYFDESRSEAVFCRMFNTGFDCRPPPPDYMNTRRRMFLTPNNARGMIEGVRDGYDTSPRRFITAVAVPQSNPVRRCLSYQSVSNYVDSINQRGDVVRSEFTGTTYNLVNTCQHDVRVTLQQGPSGGCYQSWGAIISDRLIGDRFDFTLRPGGTRAVGACQGVITAASRP